MKLFYGKIIFIFACILIFSPVTYTQQRDKFIYNQLKYRGGHFDPYPEVYREILQFLTNTTSMKVEPDRQLVTLTDKKMFSFPFLIMLGTQEFLPFTNEEIDNLRRFLLAGGILFIDNNSGQKGTGFELSIRRELARVLPGSIWENIPKTHAILRAFYLLRTVGGRRIVSPNLEGITIFRRTLVIYSTNDLAGAWTRDRLGNYLLTCQPGGEPQRIEAIKLTANIFIYSLTGTYKTDVIHFPFIEQKLKQ